MHRVIVNSSTTPHYPTPLTIQNPLIHLTDVLFLRFRNISLIFLVDGKKHQRIREDLGTLFVSSWRPRPRPISAGLVLASNCLLRAWFDKSTPNILPAALDSDPYLSASNSHLDRQLAPFRLYFDRFPFEFGILRHPQPMALLDDSLILVSGFN